MAGKPPPPKKQPKGAPTWMVTFGDMMSLLLTFFVLLFTYSSMDTAKYKALAGSLREAFGASVIDQLAGMIEPEAVATSEVPIAAAKPEETRKEHPGLPAVTLEVDEIGEEKLIEEYQEAMKSRAAILESDLKKMVAEELVGARIEVIRVDDNVVIRFPNEIAFPSGSGDINDQFGEILKSLKPLLQAAPGSLVVSGHTDNVPITGGRYRSNWDLSAARATSVVHALVDDGAIDPARVTVQGYGASRPLVPNTSDVNRAKNRRVEISIRIKK